MKIKLFTLLSVFLPYAVSAASYSLGRVSVHDPSIVWDPNSKTFYIFGSHRDNAKTTDLMKWTKVSVPWQIATSNNAANSAAFVNPAVTQVKKGGSYVSLPNFSAIAWAKRGNSNYNVDGNMWAPDVIWNKAMKKWCMYLSVNGDNWYSSIILLTADNIEGPYRYQAPVVISGFHTGNAYKDTDLELVIGTQSSLPSRYTAPWASTNKASFPNCIDPCVFYDEDGKLWMSYGSWSGGIFMLELDEETGLRDYDVTYATSTTSDPYFGKKIAGGFYVSGEASYIEYIGGYYYLFVTYGGLAAGGVSTDYNNGGYQMRVFRSTSPDGPYVDSKNSSSVFNSYLLNFGPNENDNNRGVNIFGAYTSWGNQAKGNYGERSQGHNSIIAAEDGRTYLVYHTRFQNWGESHQVRVHQVFQNQNGWLVAAPFEYTGETVTSADIASSQQIPTQNIAGKYKLLTHKYKLDHRKKEAAEPTDIELLANGTISGAATGTWSIEEGTSYITLKIGGTTYYGVMIEQTLEPTDTKTPAFTALASTNGITVWGYKYGESTTIPDNPVDGDYKTGLVAYYNFDTSPITNQLNTTQTATLQKEGSNSLPTLKTDGDRSGQVIHTNFGAIENTSNVKFVNPLAGATLSEGATMAFWLNALDQNLWDAAFAFYNPQTTARLYLTPNTYVGYNDMNGTWIDLNHPEGYASGFISFGQWNHITVTISRKNGIKVYVNGNLITFQKCNGSMNGTTVTTAESFSYGQVVNHIAACSDFYFGFGSFWGSLNADYDDLCIYNRVLTADDVKALYQAECNNESITGIEAVHRLPTCDGSIYDLQGRKLEGSLKPGIYIRNGKKFVVK